MTDVKPAAQLAPDGRETVLMRDIRRLLAQAGVDDPNRVLVMLDRVGLRIVPAADPETVTISREDLEIAVDAMSYVQDTYFWEKWGYQEHYDRLIAALQQREEGEK